jgi:hypothetical protein
MWVIYGSTLYWSEKAEGCGDENRGYMIIMLMFILLGFFKVLLFVVFLGVIAWVAIQRKIKRRNDRLASVSVLRSLQRVRFSALS